MRTIDDMQQVLSRITYRDWRLFVRPVEPDHILLPGVRASEQHWYLQWEFADAQGEFWTSRKWLLSPHMTDTELVYTAWKAVLAAEEHEARENFLFEGVPVVGPHLDVHAMAQFCRQYPMDERAGARVP